MLVNSLLHGLRLRCPNCGKGPIFESWAKLREICSYCECQIRSREKDCWFFMYMSTAFLTGVVVILMLLIFPHTLWIARMSLALGSLLLIVGSIPVRKGVALAIEHWLDSQLEHPKHHPGKPLN